MRIKDGTQIPIVATAATKAARRSGYRWIILLMLGLMALITFIDRTNISITASEIAKEFGFSKSELGWIFGAFGFAYALGQLPGGWLADLYSARKILAIVVTFWSLMTMMTAHAAGFISMVLIRFVFGLGEAAAWPALTRAMQFWFPKSERGIANGVTHSCGQFATTTVPIFAVAIMTAWGWRAVFYIFASVGLIWAIAWYWVARDLPEDHPSVNAGELAYIMEGTAGGVEARTAPNKSVPWKLILTSKNMWSLAFAYCGFGCGSWFYYYWMPSYLMEVQHFSLQRMGLLAPLPLFAGAIGTLAGGAISDFIYKRTGTLRWSRRAVCITGMLGASVLIIPAAMVIHDVFTVVLLAICNFFIFATLAPSFATAMDIAGELSGSVSGFMNMAGNITGSITTIIIGMLVQYVSWMAPFYLMAAVMLGSALLWMFVVDPNGWLPNEPLKRLEEVSDLRRNCAFVLANFDRGVLAAIRVLMV